MSNNPSPAGAGGNVAASATGQINIILNPNAQQIQRQLQQLGAAGAGIGAGVNQGVSTANRALGSLEGTIKQVGAAFAGAFAIGSIAKSTLQVNQLNALFKVLSGSEERAVQNMDALRELAERTNQPFLQLVESSAALLPAIGRTNVDLAKTTQLAQRLAILDPAQGAQGAAIAIRELLSGTYTSLAMRFEMPKNQLKQLLEDSGGDPAKIIDGLDQIVAEMGLTNEAMEEMGASGVNSFAILRSELQETSAQAFTPFLNDVVIPLVRGIGDLVAQLRSVNPELMQTAGIVAGIAASAAALNRTPILGNLGAGQAVAGAGVAYGAWQLGIAGARGAADAGLVNRPDLENTSQADAQRVIVESAVESISDLVGIFMLGAQTWLNSVEFMADGAGVVQDAMGIGAAEIQNAFIELTNAVEEAGVNLTSALADVVEALGQFIIDLPGDFGLDDRGRDLKDSAAGLRREFTPTETIDIDALKEEFRNNLADFLAVASDWRNLMPDQDQADFITSFTDQLEQTLKDTLLPAVSGPELTGTQSGSPTASAPLTARDYEGFTEEQLAAWEEFQESLADIDAQAQEQRLAQQEAYQQQVIDSEAAYQRTLEREAVDEQRRQQEARRRLNRSLEDTREQGATREREILADNAERVADIRTQYQDEERDRLERHERDLARMQRDSRERLLDAVSRLDARAVFEELSKRSQRTEDAQTAFDQETEDRKADLQERLTEEAAENAARLEQNRAQTAQRLADLQASFAEEQTENARQRQFKLERMAEDHAFEMAQLEQQNLERLAQIDKQAAREKEKQEQAFIKTYNKLAEEAGQSGNRMIQTQRKVQAQIEREFGAWLNRMQAQVAQRNGAARTPRTGNQLGSGGAGMQMFATGIGNVPYDQVAGLHQGEAVLSAPVAAFMRHLAGSTNPSQADMVNVMRGGGAGGNRSLQVGDIHMNFPADIGSYSPDEIMGYARQALMDALQEIAS